MAAAFKIGQEVTIEVTKPQGAVEKIQFNDTGDIQYLISYVDNAGENHSRWFNEEDLVAV